MASFNKVILMGRLTADPELKQSQSGASVTSFNIAVDRRYVKEGQEKQTDFPPIVAWSNTAEFICRNFGKGQAILVVGELQIRTWTDNNGQKRYATEVVASEAYFCEGKKNSEGTSPSQPQFSSQSEFKPNYEETSSDDDFPF
jgi:single-strand DNA-binding protein